MRIGFIGPGQMGRPMVDRIVGAGHDVTVHARRDETADELRAAGLVAVRQPRDAVAGAEVVIVCVFDDAQLRSVLLDDGALDAARSGAVVISHVTGSPRTARTLRAAAPSGVDVLDVPVSGTAADIGDGRLTLLVGGDASALERARPALASYGDPIVHVGDLGTSQVVKLLNNALFSATFRAACDAALLAEQTGIPHERFVSVVQACSGDSFALRVLQRGSPADVARGVQRYLRKDVAAAQVAASELGLDLGRLGRWAAWFDDP
jgi:3-hydroxyisobutyrate dehydrogenase-like beta-hydroxyacid dehydrogenase